MSRILGLGDSAAKTMLRRMGEAGLVEKRGRVGVEASNWVRDAFASLRLCSTGDAGRVCVAFDTCSYFCSATSQVIRLRDALVVHGLQPTLIMCCDEDMIAPGAPSQYIDEYGGACRGCNGRRLCIVVENPLMDPVVVVARTLAAVASIECSTSRSS